MNSEDVSKCRMIYSRSIGISDKAIMVSDNEGIKVLKRAPDGSMQIVGPFSDLLIDNKCVNYTKFCNDTGYRVMTDGYAVCKTVTNRWGKIDVEGNVVVPFMFKGTPRTSADPSMKNSIIMKNYCGESVSNMSVIDSILFEHNKVVIESSSIIKYIENNVNTPAGEKIICFGVYEDGIMANVFSRSMHRVSIGAIPFRNLKVVYDNANGLQLLIAYSGEKQGNYVVLDSELKPIKSF